MPAGPPLSSRITAALLRWARLLRLSRVVPLLLVAGAVTVVTVGAPMVSGAVTSFTDPVALESTATSAGRSAGAAGSGGTWFSGGSSSSDGSSSGGSVAEPLVRMGVDGDSPPPSAAPVPAAPSAGTPAPVSPFVPSTEASEPESESGSGSASGSATGSGSGAGSATGSGSAPAGAAETSRSPQPAREDAAPAAGGETEPAPVARAAVPADPSAETAVLTLVNEARADAGCDPVTADPALAAVARAHSADMRDRDYFSHTSPEGLSPFDRAEQAGVDYSRAENIAFGQADAAAVMEAWLESPGHRANILDCDLTKLGVGVAEGTGGPWWTQLFGA
jgi:uncharacterized protein YkwD